MRFSAMKMALSNIMPIYIYIFSKNWRVGTEISVITEFSKPCKQSNGSSDCFRTILSCADKDRKWTYGYTVIVNLSIQPMNQVSQNLKIFQQFYVLSNSPFYWYYWSDQLFYFINVNVTRWYVIEVAWFFHSFPWKRSLTLWETNKG